MLELTFKFDSLKNAMDFYGSLKEDLKIEKDIFLFETIHETHIILVPKSDKIAEMATDVSSRFSVKSIENKFIEDNS